MRTRSGYDVKVEVTGTEGSVATEANPTSFPLLRKDGQVGVGIATIEGWLDRFEETCEPRSDSDPGSGSAAELFVGRTFHDRRVVTGALWPHCLAASSVYLSSVKRIV